MRQLQPPRMPVPRAPSSGNAGVSRDKFSKAQVKQMIDEWGREEDAQEDDEDYYYDGTSDSSADNEGHEQFKQSLERGHHNLQYTMSQSPGAPKEGVSPSGGAPIMPSSNTSEDDDEFHYQHHRVTAYSNSKYTAAGNMSARGGQNSYDGEGDQSGGIFASAKNWLQSQRERLHQLELEIQVEDQRRKLVEEGRRQRAMESDRRRGIAGNATSNNANVANTNGCEITSSGSFGCIDGQAVVEHSEELGNIPEQSLVVTGVMPSLCGFGGAYANQLDDATDYSGVPRVDSAGNILELIPSGSLESLEGEFANVCMKVSSPKCTLSGKGMSVKVDLPDDNDYLNRGNNAIYGNNLVEEEDDPTISFECDVKVVPEPPQDDISTSPPILQPSQMKSLIAAGGLPPSLNFCKWKRLYNLTRDGDSFEQFLRLVNGHDRTVLVVKTTRGQMFGGYADTRWQARHNTQYANEFYGSAQAFLFRFPNYGEGMLREDKIITYRWSGANRYIQLCDSSRRTVAFGGGGEEGGFGLCIEDDFRRGTTGHCSTFENKALCEEGYFDVMDLEVWGFALDYV